MPRLSNRKRERFACEIAACTPYATAYVSAGYADTEWAPYNANRLAHTPEVAARIAELQAEFEKQSQIKVEYIHRKILPIVQANAADLFEPQGDLFEGKNRLKPLSKLPRDLSAAISKVKLDPETGRVMEITLHGKIEAGNVLLRSLGGIVERQETKITLEDLVNASFQGAAACSHSPDNADANTTIRAGHINGSNK